MKHCRVLGFEVSEQACKGCRLCRSYALEAERKMGEMLRETERARPGPERKDRLHDVTEPPTLAELGITRKESTEAQMLAAVTPETTKRNLLTRQNAYLILKSMTPDDLKAWREKQGYTQVTLAQALNVDEMTVSRWERGVTQIPGFLALALKALECKGGEKKSRDTKTDKGEEGKHAKKNARTLQAKK